MLYDVDIEASACILSSRYATLSFVDVYTVPATAGPGPHYLANVIGHRHRHHATSVPAAGRGYTTKL